MHGVLGAARIDDSNPKFTRSGWPDGRPARQIGAVHEPLERNISGAAGSDEGSCRAGVGRVTLICIDLQHRPAVEADLMLGLVAVGVVGMGRMGAIGTEHQTCGPSGRCICDRCAESRLQQLDLMTQERGCGPGRRDAADLLVIEQADHRDRSTRRISNRHKSSDRQETRQKVVDTCRAQKVVTQARQCRRRQIVRHEVECKDRISGDTDLLCEVLGETRTLAESPHR